MFSSAAPSFGSRLLLLALVLRLSAGVVGSVWAQPAHPGARLAFPNRGVVNAFVIFVQHADDPDYSGEFGSDPETEWPVDHSLGPDRLLPAWAEGNKLLSPPGTSPEEFDEGSLSAFYHQMSHGRFTITGYVYPKVYIPKHPIEWYHENRGAFQNGASRRSHEILTSDEIQAYLNENPDGLDLRALDTYRNGTFSYMNGGDGIFDLIILIDRNTTLPRLRRDDAGKSIGGSSITSLGIDNEVRKDFVDYTNTQSDGFASDPVVLGGMRVIDNLTSGSGVLTYAQTRKQAVRIIAHEIGHRHFGFYHTCTSDFSPNSDCIGIMGGAYLTMSAGDRIKLGWTEIVPIDMENHESVDVVFEDAIRSGKVYRIRQGEDRCGDVIVEARLWTNFWDAPPNPHDPSAPFYLNDDGDQADLFLPQEGLYVYKAPQPGASWCGGNRNPSFEYAYFSSMENSGLYDRLVPFRAGRSEELRAFRPGGAYRVAYEPGDVYAPYRLPLFYFHESALDEKLTISDIKRVENGFSARIWTDYLSGPPDRMGLHVANYPNPFDDDTIIEYELPQEAEARVEVFDVLGRRVAVLVEGRHQPGVHRTYFDASSLSPGFYYCRINANGQTTTHPMQVVR